MKTWFRLFLAACLGLSSVSAAAADGEDLLLQNLYPAELVMRHQARIDLTAEQRREISEAVKAAQGRIVELQWEVETAMQSLLELLAGSRVDEAAAVAQAEKVVGLETEVKKEHLKLLIRIKNALTEGQQARLRELRR